MLGRHLCHLSLPLPLPRSSHPVSLRDGLWVPLSRPHEPCLAAGPSGDIYGSTWSLGAGSRGQAAPPEQSSPAQVLITRVLNNAKRGLLGLVNFVWGTGSLREAYYRLIACQALTLSHRRQPASQRGGRRIPWEPPSGLHPGNTGASLCFCAGSGVSGGASVELQDPSEPAKSTGLDRQAQEPASRISGGQSHALFTHQGSILVAVGRHLDDSTPLDLNCSARPALGRKTQAIGRAMVSPLPTWRKVQSASS